MAAHGMPGLCRSMYNIAGTYLKDQGLPNRSPWAHDVTGRYFGWLCVQAAGAPAHLQLSSDGTLAAAL